MLFRSGVRSILVLREKGLTLGLTGNCTASATRASSRRRRANSAARTATSSSARSSSPRSISRQSTLNRSATPSTRSASPSLRSHFTQTFSQLKFFNNFVLDPGHLSISEGTRDNGPPQPRFESGSYPPPPSYNGPRGDGPRGDPRGDGPRGDVRRGLSDRIGDRLEEPMLKRRREEGPRGPPLPPPEGMALDPRARKGASSYADLVSAGFSGRDGQETDAGFRMGHRRVRRMWCCLTEMFVRRLQDTT